MKARKRTWKHYGLDTYELEDGTEWAIGTPAQVKRAVRESILDSLWAFRPEFLSSFTGLPKEVFSSVSEKMSEDASPVIAKMIRKSRLGKFVAEAVRADGVGHFLSPYDGNEDNSSHIPGLPPGKIAFRLN